MKQIDYFKIIHKHIPQDSPAYKPYIIHVILVTQKAIQAAKHIGLSTEQIQFIEEAAMLHDIGVIKVNAPEIGCNGPLRYLYHMPEGRKILESENLTEHAKVCEGHTTITELVVKNKSMDIPVRDYSPKTIEQECVAWADKFYSKGGEHFWIPRTVDQIRESRQELGQPAIDMFNKWNKKFNK